MIFNFGRGPRSFPDAPPEAWTPACPPLPEGVYGEPGRAGREPGQVPVRLAGRAGGARFRQGLAPLTHSSWSGRGRQGRVREAPVPTPGALALVSARLGRGNGASGPAARGSKEPPPALREVATAAARVSRPQTAPSLRTSSPAAPRPRPVPSGATHPPEASPGRRPQAGVLGPRAPIQSRPPPPRPASAAFRPSPHPLQPGLQPGNVIRPLPET